METERVVTLSTCTNTSRNYRYLVHGVFDKGRKELKVGPVEDERFLIPVFF